MSALSRRTLLKSALGAGTCLAESGLASLVTGNSAKAQVQLLEPVTTQFELIPGKPTQNIYSYLPEGPAPVLYARQGEMFHTRLVNGLAEPTTVHWHGLRLPNDMDGVPFLTQPYVYPGETFDYRFTPPDAGTFWYHPHCNTLEQMSFGLNGAFVVQEAEDPGFDTDVVLNLRDWRLGSDGQFISLYKARKAARAGTYGTVKTANWATSPVYELPAGSLVRLRILVSDVTRIYRLAVTGAEATVIAKDGYPLSEIAPLKEASIGPGQRMDLVIRMPDEEGATIDVRNLSTTRPWTVASLKSSGLSLQRDVREIRPLPANPVAQPDLNSAETIRFEFTATAEQAPKSGYCGTLGFSFWAINRRPWSGVSPDPMAPLAELKLGRSYIFSLLNRTPHSHPVHLHGLAFRPIRSNKRVLPAHVTDTVLILPDEQIDVALVADNPGDWLLHCHVIEHQKTGMAGFIRVI
ncbi:MAG: multicopper oxidase family protein [Stappiaceae bacterium]